MFSRSAATSTLPVLLALTTAIGWAQSPPTLDGNLEDFRQVWLEIQANPTLRAFGMNQLDNFGNNGAVGDEGFCDDPLNPTACPPLGNPFRMFSPINAGNFFLIYKPDSDGIVFPPEEDDSWFAIGVNIANGDGDVSFFAPPCDNFPWAPYLPDWIMVPFDCDGDGDPGRLGIGVPDGIPGNHGSRWWNPENPGELVNPVNDFDEVKDAIDLSIRLCNAGLFTGEPDERIQPADIRIYYEQEFNWPTKLRVYRRGVEIPTNQIPTFFAVDVFPPNGSPASGPVILDGGNGIAETTADGGSDDTQQIPVGFPASGNQVIVGPGVDHILQTVPGGDDIVVNTMSIFERGLDGWIGPDGRGNDDIEFLITQFDSKVSNLLFVPNTGYANAADYYHRYVRHGLANMYFGLRSESSGDLSAEDTMSLDVNMPLPWLEVSKKVRCLNTAEPGAPNEWRDHAEALAGSIVEFLITVENTGDTDLGVTLQDVFHLLSGGVSFTVVPNFIQGTYYPYDGPSQPLGPGQVPPLLNPVFFALGGPGSPSFLGGAPLGLARELGVLRGAEYCIDAHDGDKVEFMFRAVVNGGCTEQATPDLDNSIAAFGVPIGVEAPHPEDLPYVVDTPFETIDLAGQDDNVVTVNILCREITLQKLVRKLPDGVFSSQISIAEGELPVTIEYQYTVTNPGEVDEDIVLSDLFLCQDIAAVPGVDFVAGQCDLCEVPPSGQIQATIPAGGSQSWTCQVSIADAVALDAFMARDDVGGHESCRNATSPEDCYRNCATVTATANGADIAEVCDGAPALDAESDATVCKRGCKLDVEKFVRCCEDGPEGGWLGTAIAVPGSCVEFLIKVFNRDPVNPGNTDLTPICALRFTDLLLPLGQFELSDPVTVTFQMYDEVGNPVACAFTLDLPAACFDADGCAFDIDLLNTPGCGILLEPFWRLEATFQVGIPSSATPGLVTNTADVYCAEWDTDNLVCLAFTFNDVDEADVDILRPALSCDKEWSATWDSDGDCEPGPAFIGCTDPLDLGAAHGGEAVVFPIELCLCLTAYNNGDVDLLVTPDDSAFCQAVENTPGVSFVGECEICDNDLAAGDNAGGEHALRTDRPDTGAAFGGAAGGGRNEDGPPVVSKLIPAGGSATWTCCIRVETAEAMRLLAQNDGGVNPDVFENLVSVNGAIMDEDTCEGDSVSSTCDATVIPPPPCDIDVIKEVKCADDPDAAYASSIDALPGSRVTYRVRVLNTSGTVKLPRVCIEDVLGCTAWYVNGSVAMSVGGVPAPQAWKDRFQTALLAGATDCYWFGPYGGMPAWLPNPWIPPGGELVITFDVIVPADFDAGAVNCVPGADPDCENDVSVWGYSEVCPADLPPPDDYCAGPEEAHAAFNVLVPAIECAKEVAVDAGNDGSIDYDPATAPLPCNVTFPIRVIWRYTVTNTGETGLVNVEICDALFPAGCLPLSDLPNCNDSASTTYEMIFNTFEEWCAFADDNDPACYTNTAFARADVDVTDICDYGAQTIVESDACTAELCVQLPCDTSVTKEARCLSACDGTPVGNFSHDPQNVVADGAVEFRVTVVNNAGDCRSQTVCAFRITDTLIGPIELCANPMATFRVLNAANVEQCTFTVPGFNASGTEFEVILPAQCPALQPGWKLEFTFRAHVLGTALPSDTLRNEVIVVAAADCPVGEDPVFCCEDNDMVELGVLAPSARCVDKTWSVRWDSDANCVLNVNDQVIPPAESIDLGTADGGEAILFPANLTLNVAILNDGDVPLNVTVSDPEFCAAVNATAGVNFVTPPTCEVCGVPVTKLIMPGATASWSCTIRVETDEAMRQLAANDGGTDPNVFENRPTVVADIVAGGLDLCVPPGVEQIEVNVDDCYAEIIPPPPCEFTLTKQLVCLDQCGGNPVGAPADHLDVVPGACVRFIITICNTSPVVKLPRFKIKDCQVPAGWYANQCRADIGGTDVSNCICPLWNVNCVEQQYRFTGGCTAHDPWLGPGECLTITYDAQIPTGFSVVGDDPDLTNEVTVKGYTRGCAPPGPLTDDPCHGPLTDDATVNVYVPVMTCEKKVEIDYGDDGSVDVGPGSNVLILDGQATFPLRIRFLYEVFNNGELDLTSVLLCDAQLVNSAVAVLAPAENCALCTGPCDGNGDTCVDLGTIPPGGSATASCEVVIDSIVQLLQFFAADFDGNPMVYSNEAIVSATADADGWCGPNSERFTNCSAVIFYEADSCPGTKAKIWIWNANEVLLGGTERCVRWDQRRLSIWPGPGLPNHFLVEFLHTDHGHARIDGMESTVCPDSVDSPLLGVFYTIHRLDGIGDRIVISGREPVGAGLQVGQIILRTDRSAQPDGRTKPRMADHALLSQDAWVSAAHPIEFGPPEERAESRTPEEPGVTRGNSTQKGSLLIFPKIEVKWNAAGEVVQDTFITVNNDYLADVSLIAYLVNAEPETYPLDCEKWVDNEFVLTHDEPAYWSVLTGLPKGVSPITVFGGPVPDPDPLNPGGTHMHGYLIIHAVNDQLQEMQWNHLFGSATLVNYVRETAWEYNAMSFRARPGGGGGNGQPLYAPFGTLDLDGNEYDYCPDVLALDFFAPGATLISVSGGVTRTNYIYDVDLTLMMVNIDLSDAELEP